ncbi:MAG TPA: hypothetical protein VER39_11375 [Nocardioidaceae bacterium]|nr:hypothetical protein [Nocardioidaceae bacterium]
MHRRHLLVPLACLGLTSTVTVGATQPAVADQSAASHATVTLQGGGLSISAPTQPGNLGTRSSSVGAVTIQGRLGRVEVTDARGAPAGSGWTASAVSTAFTQRGGPSIGAGSVGYTAGDISHTGTATLVANDPNSLTGVSPVVTATEVTGDNTATWNPTIHIEVGANLPAGIYSGTITHSVS